MKMKSINHLKKLRIKVNYRLGDELPVTHLGNDHELPLTTLGDEFPVLLWVILQFQIS